MTLVAIGTLLNQKFGLFKITPTKVEGLIGVVDLYPEETHNLTVNKTSYPIETGSSMTDNSVVMPKKLTLQGWVSDLKPLIGGLVAIEGPSRAKEAWNRIRILQEGREPVLVVTTLGTYKNMLIKTVDAVIDSTTGRTLKFTMALEEVLFAETKIVKLSAKKLGKGNKKGSAENGGLKQAAESKSSFLKGAVKGITSFFK
jgi:hypothetical protein